MHTTVVTADGDDAVTNTERSLRYLLTQIATTGYRFITPTPLTHHRFLDRCSSSETRTLRDIFGWNRVFQRDDVSPSMLTAMTNAGVISDDASALSIIENLRSNVRIASIESDLFLHSAFPTTDEASVFFGPDTYRFVRFVGNFFRTNCATTISHAQPRPWRILDIGCGSGAGGIVAARACANLGHDVTLTLADISAQALTFAAINAAFANITATTILSDGVHNISGDFDLIIANPPYLHDQTKRLYRHGGERLGRALSVRLATESLGRLAPGGTLLLYTGVVIVGGIDGLLAELQMPLHQSECQWSYAEIDPDVFGEELEQPAYRHAERIAAVGLIATHSKQAVK